MIKRAFPRTGWHNVPRRSLILAAIFLLLFLLMLFAGRSGAETTGSISFVTSERELYHFRMPLVDPLGRDGPLCDYYFPIPRQESRPQLV